MKELEKIGWTEENLRKISSRDIVLCEGEDEYRGPVLRVEVKPLEDKDGTTSSFLSFTVKWIAFKSGDLWFLTKLPLENEVEGYEICSLNSDFSNGLINHIDGSFTMSIPYIGTVKILAEKDNLDLNSVSSL